MLIPRHIVCSNPCLSLKLSFKMSAHLAKPSFNISAQLSSSQRSILFVLPCATLSLFFKKHPTCTLHGFYNTAYRCLQVPSILVDVSLKTKRSL